MSRGLLLADTARARELTVLQALLLTISVSTRTARVSYNINESQFDCKSPERLYTAVTLIFAP